METLKIFLKEDGGQDLVEYALIAVIIALGCIAGMNTLATAINNEFSQVSIRLT